MRTTVIAALLAAGLVVGACGGDDKSASTTSSTTTSTSTPTSTSTSTSTSTTTTSTTVPTTTSAPVASPAVLTESGIGALKLGMTLAAAKATKMIGATKPGCELGGPGELVAPLVGPARGSVFFTDQKLSGISITSGAKTPAGIGPGSTLAAIQAVYNRNDYRTSVDESGRETFGFDFVSVEHNGSAVYGGDLDPKTKRIATLWMPSVRTCE
jgi:hypothetical protein